MLRHGGHCNSGICDAYPEAHCDGYTSANRDCYAETHCDGYTSANRDCHAKAQPYTDTNPHTYAYTCCSDGRGSRF